MKNRINGYLFEEMVLNGLNNLINHEKEINAMNVFPVADGDTGTNMRLTLENGYKKAAHNEHLGQYLKELYAAVLEEYDFTYSHDRNMKYGWEVGARAEYPIREGVKWTGTARYTDYVHYTKYVPTDLRYDMELTTKLEVDLTDTLAFAPYISYRRGQARGTKKVGSNLMIGLQLKYADLFNL